FQIDLANSLNETGDTLRVVGRMSEARDSYDRAIVILQGLVQTNPTVAQSRVWLAPGLKGLGGFPLADRPAAQAVDSWRRAVAIGEGLRTNYSETLYYLASCHALLGGVAGTPGSGLSAEDGPAELDRAMATLRRAVAAGYGDAIEMRRDPDLDPLR